MLGQISLALSVHGAGQVVTWPDMAPFGYNLTNVVQIASPLALTADGTIIDLSSRLPTGVTQAAAIAVGTDGINWQFSLALRNDGSVVGWGDDSYGQTDVPSGLSGVVSIAAGMQHSLALKADGTVIAWGDNSCGQTNVPTGLSGVVQIAAAGLRSVALRADGSVVAWGSPLENDVPAGLERVVKIAACGGNNLALKEDGTVVAWGYYSVRCPENPPVCGHPAFVPQGLTNVVAIGGITFYSLAVDASGIVTAWPWPWGARDWSYTGNGLQPVSAIVGYEIGTALAIVGDGPSVASIRVANPTQDGQRFSCSLSTESGKVYRLEYADRLNGGVWAPLPLVAGNGGSQKLTDPTTPVTTQRFYRARSW
jgi:hypothetical protein